jgi:HSP20 family protein
MSENNADRNNKLLGVLVGLLIAVVAVQGYYLYGIYNGNKTNGVHALMNTDDPIQDKDWQLAPGAGNSNTSSSPNPLLNSPFDPNGWDPFKEMEEMHKQMEQMFQGAFGRFNASPKFNSFSQGLSFNPTMDIEEHDNKYIVRMDIPGADSSKINVSIEDRLLTISGTREEEVSQQGPNAKQLRSERRLGQFERVMTLPGPVKQSEMKADYEDGVLTVTIPKDNASSKSNTITVQ